MTAFLAEFIGTMILVILGCGVVGGVTLKGTKSEGSGWIVVAFGWGLAVAIAIYTVGSYSGGHLNPAVTFGLAIIGQFDWGDVPSYVIAQLAGAIFGAVIVYFHYLPHWKNTISTKIKLGVFVTYPAIKNTPANLLSEIIGTFIFVLGILTIGANKFTDGLNPLIIGFLVVAIGLSLGGTTGYAINPARDLGPRIAHYLLPIQDKGSSRWGYAWIPVIGPILGGIYGALFYQSIFLGTFQLSFWLTSALIFLIMIWAFLQDRYQFPFFKNFSDT